MAEEILVKEPLTKEMVEAGQELLNRIEQAGDPNLVAAFWRYKAEGNNWQLVLVSPQAESNGVISVLGKVRSLIYGPPGKIPGIDLLDITVIGSHERIASGLAERNRKYNLSGQRLSNYYVNGIFIDDGYMYFMRPDTEPPA